MLIPEIILYNTLKAFKKLVQDDYTNASDKTQTILNDLFALDNNQVALQQENYNYLEQAISVFTRTDQNPRTYQVNIGYNLQRAFLPTIHILLPQESSGRYDSIGYSEGEISSIYNINSAPQSQVDTRIKTYSATFDLLITSDNTSEVLLLYYFIKAMILFAADTLELLGLHNFKLTGMDIQLDDKYAPNNIFHRSLRAEFDYQSEIKVRNSKQFSGILNLMICNNIGFDYANANKDSQARQQVSNNFVINVTKQNQKQGNVGYVRFTNKLTKIAEDPIEIEITSSSNFQLAGDLDPANYNIEINIMNLTGDIKGNVTDGANIDREINSAGQFSYYTQFDFTNVGTKDIIINLNFI